MQKDPINTIKDLAEPIVQQHDMFLVDVELKQNDGNVIWVLVDSEADNINLKSCTQISKQLSFLVESADLFMNPYRLNVSSPGLSRPLSDIRQYSKNKGRNVKVKCKTEEGYEKIEGTLTSASTDKIVIDVGSNGSIDIPFADIVETKIVPKI